MNFCGKECKEYFRYVWPFMLASFLLGALELVLFKLEVFNFKRINFYYAFGLILLIALGMVLQRKGFNKRQTAVSSLFCLLAVAWLPPFLAPALSIPWYFKLINLAIMYLANAVLYIVASLVGWLIGSAINKKSNNSQRKGAPNRIIGGKRKKAKR